MPFELRPFPSPTLKPESDYLQSAWRRSVYPLAEKLGVEIKLPAVSPQPYTNLAFQGLEFSKDHDRADAYNDAVFRAFFQQSRDIGSIDALTDIAASAGLDAHAFREALEQQTYRGRVQELLRRANRHIGIEAVPTFIIGQYRLNGLYPADVLSKVIADELVSRSG
jgi:predicted DsbA family dithiol-disulfide isomerase